MSGVVVLRTPAPRIRSNTFRFLVAACAAAAALLAGPASAVINVPGDQPTIAAALAVAVPSDVILVAPGTYVISSTLAASTANVTLQGSGISSTRLQTSGGADMMLVTGANFTLRDFKIEKTDLAVQNMIAIQANNCTVRDNEIYGVDPGSLWSVNGLVIRAMVVSPGLSGLLIQGNNIHHVRQPAYIDAGTGTVTANTVSGTRGWVIAGATVAFSGNSFGPPQNQGADIALLSTCNPLDYPNLLALSSGNGNAYVDAQFGSAPDGRADGYVDVAAPAPAGRLQGAAALPYLLVQDGVNGTLPGGTVHVAAGAYTEQVLVSGKNLTVRGAGVGSTTLQAPASLVTQFTTSGPNKPVLHCFNAGDIRVEDMKIDGMGNGNANNRLVGLSWRNAGGSATNVNIVRVRNSPLDGVQAGTGVMTANTTGGPYSLTLTNVNVSDFQKNGMTLTGNGLTVSIVGGSVAGAGNTAAIAQNGIQISGGAGGAVNGCGISALRYTPASVVSVGLLVFGPGSVAASNMVGASKFSGVQVPAYFIDANGSMNGAEVDATSSDQGAIFAYNSSLSAVKTPTNQARSGAPVASPAEDPATDAVRRDGNALLSSLAFSVSNACLSGSGATNTQGVGVFSDGGPMAATVTNCTISGWDQGIYAGGAAATVEAHDNAISGNVSAGFDNSTSGAAQDAERNWWGAANGPSGAGPGSGDAIVGSNVDFNPWRVSGADLSASCGFQPDSDNEVSPGPVPSCIAAGNACITIPVSINRTDSANLRGYSVDVQLSANLILCSTPGASITVGPYLATGAGINGTSFQVTNNGGGSYTVDQAILGLPCGATGSGGTIFNLSVKAAGGDGTGTITITSVTLRDCDNGPLAASIGAPVNITIDQTAPAPITLLAAAQVKTGNDGDGTTKITLTWPAVEAGATVEVYRRGFGNYPEYDDPPTPGSAPSAPTYPPPGSWALTTVTTSGSPDEVAWPARDFWYYVAFVKDGCGNVSAVSNRTNGTLNYHLGDVTNGFTAGVGDNQVGTVDITLLGANYGLIGLAVNPVNYLDVGPTTDFSTNARPTTDNKIGFEDLIMFAINYGPPISAPGPIADRASSRADALTLATEGDDMVGGMITARLRLAGSGRIQGVSTRLSWNPRAVEPIGFAAGDLVSNANGVVFSPAAGTVDAALLGVREAGLEGEGELASVRFRVIGEGDPGIAVAEVVARDAQNQPVSMGAPIAADGVLPKATRLLLPSPNPAPGASTLAFSMAQPGRVDLAIYSVDGRRVKTILAETRAAGFHSVAWDGTGDDGRRAPAGVYFARMITFDGGSQSRTLTLLSR